MQPSLPAVLPSPAGASSCCEINHFTPGTVAAPRLCCGGCRPSGLSELQPVIYRFTAWRRKLPACHGPRAHQPGQDGLGVL